MLKTIFKGKTLEQKIEKRVSDVFVQLTSTIETEFTELETVQILNMVRRKTHEHLSEKRANCLDQSILMQQKAEEIKHALDVLE